MVSQYFWLFKIKSVRGIDQQMFTYSGVFTDLMFTASGHIVWQIKPIVVWRCVDDMFAAFNDMSVLDIFFNALCSVRKTPVLPKNWSVAIPSLTLLDVLIEKSQTAIQTYCINRLIQTLFSLDKFYS